ncbi:unnamed protein product, partial [Symbiodinium sp. KB8]
MGPDSSQRHTARTACSFHRCHGQTEEEDVDFRRSERHSSNERRVLHRLDPGSTGMGPGTCQWYHSDRPAGSYGRDGLQKQDVDCRRRA